MKTFPSFKSSFYFVSLPQKCFKCSKCKRSLDYGSLAEGPDNELYCKEWIQLVFLGLLVTIQLGLF